MRLRIWGFTQFKVSREAGQDDITKGPGKNLCESIHIWKD